MEREHIQSADSQIAFSTPNYGVTSTSEIEWWYRVPAPYQLPGMLPAVPLCVAASLHSRCVGAFCNAYALLPDYVCCLCHVASGAHTRSTARLRTPPRRFCVDPERGVEKLKLTDGWPKEEKLRHRREEFMRQCVPLSELQGARHNVNAQLRSMGEPELSEAEMIACRMYTGPMYVKCACLLSLPSHPATQPRRRAAERVRAVRLACPLPSARTPPTLSQRPQSPQHRYRYRHRHRCGGHATTTHVLDPRWRCATSHASHATCPRGAGHLVAVRCPVADNLTLRSKSGNTSLAARARAVCRDNLYVTTLHCINSAVVKGGKLTRVCKVYRGISNSRLPKAFTQRSAHGVRGGVENAFTSTSKERDVALAYASAGGAGMLLEIQMGMIDRGADLSWLSQYPHESE